MDLTKQGITASRILRNASPATLYKEALLGEEGTSIADNGAIIAMSGEKTGRCPKDKRVVGNGESTSDVWWGKVNIKFPEQSFVANRKIAIDFLNSCDRLFVVDGFAGWEKESRIKVRIICSRAYHALFMHNMLIRPTKDELDNFGEPEYVVFNAGQQDADTSIEGVENPSSVALNFAKKEFVILGTEYAGEMKKGIFTIMNYLLPKKGIMSMHCSANSTESDTALFFGLSGTGKTTLSANPKRRLIGDDEHGWSDNGVFNIEGGCYAKCLNLTEIYEPEIYRAIRFGSVLENVVYDKRTGEVDYTDSSITENTRASYPIHFIPNAKNFCVGKHPRDVIFLTCDAFGVLPPVSRLDAGQAMYHFISGYTAKVAGTEVGVTEPEATFSTCFGAPFLVLHPTVYAKMLAEKIATHETRTWLINTGWSGGGFGAGQRINLKYTRAIVDAIHDDELVRQDYITDPVFGLEIPTKCRHVPDNVLIPKGTWADTDAYHEAAAKLAKLFHENFQQYSDVAGDETKNGGPLLGR